MIALGIIFGLLAFCAINSLVGEFVIARPGAGVVPGLVAAIWASYPFFTRTQVENQKLLHPATVKYPVNVQAAFSKIRRILGESSYFYGDKWYVVTADTATNCIVADLRFYEEEVRMETSGYGHCHQRQVRMQRFIRLNLTLSPEGIGESNVQMDFEIRAEGFNNQSCKNIVTDLKARVEEEIGPGQVSESLTEYSNSPAPWWLIGATSFALICMFIDINKNFWGS